MTQMERMDEATNPFVPGYRILILIVVVLNALSPIHTWSYEYLSVSRVLADVRSFISAVTLCISL